MRLHTRLTLTFGALLVVLAVALFGLLTHISERYHAEVSQRLNAGIAMYVTDQTALLDRNGVNRAALNELAHRAMTLNPSAEVYLLTPDGRILATLAREMHRRHARYPRAFIGADLVNDTRPRMRGSACSTRFDRGCRDRIRPS